VKCQKPLKLAGNVAEWSVVALPARCRAREAVEDKEEISYHAVEKNGTITAIWEMRGRRHVRTIDPRSVEGRHLLGTPESSEAAAG
jgi:hypothetical protein